MILTREVFWEHSGRTSKDQETQAMRCKLSLFTLIVALNPSCWVEASEGDRYPGPPDDKALGGGVVVSTGNKTRIDTPPTIEPPISSAAHNTRLPVVGGIRPVGAVTVEPVAPTPRFLPSTGNYSPPPVAMTKPLASPAQISAYPVIPTVPELSYTLPLNPSDSLTGSPTTPRFLHKGCGSCEWDLFSKFSAWLKYSRPHIETDWRTTPHRPPYWAWIDCNNRYRWGSLGMGGVGTCGTPRCESPTHTSQHYPNEYLGTGKLPGLPTNVSVVPNSVVSPAPVAPHPSVSQAPVAPPPVTKLPQVDPLSSFKGPVDPSEMNSLSEGYKRPPGVPISRPYR